MTLNELIKNLQSLPVECMDFPVIVTDTHGNALEILQSIPAFNFVELIYYR